MKQRAPRAPQLASQDKLALMMTSAGSQRNLAALVGVSHQRIGRWLAGPKVNLHTGELSNLPPPEVMQAINQAFAIHKDIAREQARIDRLPFNAQVPVYMERLKFANGKPGERVIAKHTNYMSNELRNRVIVDTAKTGKFIGVSQRSKVNLKKYMTKAENMKFRRTRKQIERRSALKGVLSEGVEQLPIYTKTERLVTMFGGVIRPVDPDLLAHNLDTKLRTKHEPSTGDKGTALADQILWQTIPAYFQPLNHSAPNEKTAKGSAPKRSRKR